jgi:uncharacterized protein (TIGR03067 family)
MRIHRLCVLIALVLAGSVSSSDQKPAKTDQERMQGNWDVVSLNANGKDVDEAPIKSAKVKIAGNQLTLVQSDPAKEDVVTIAIDPTQTPKTIEVTHHNADANAKPLRGIYELTATDLVIALSTDPDDFAPTDAKPGEKRIVLTLRRPK